MNQTLFYSCIEGCVSLHLVLGTAVQVASGLSLLDAEGCHDRRLCTLLENPFGKFQSLIQSCLRLRVGRKR